MNTIIKTYLDLSERWDIGFQDPATPVMEGIIDLHHSIMFFLVIIMVIVYRIFMDHYDAYVIPFTILKDRVQYHMGLCLTEKSDIKYMHAMRIDHLKNNYIELIKKFNLNVRKYDLNFTFNTMVEIIWTIIPSAILIIIAIPSFMLLYSIDEVIDPQITIKIMGHQWFWSYETFDLFEYNLKSIYNYDSYMIPTEELTKGQLRLLEVDLPLYLPIRTHIRLLISASDVLHAWSVPSLGVKMDAVPGRLNQVSLFIKRKGVFYGQCSELCGINHGFMPIVVKAISIENYLKYFSMNLN